jgi:DNA mismatch repair protein MutS2
MINELTLEKLQWPLLLDYLAGEAQTLEGRDACLALTPKFDTVAIEERWQDVIPLRDLIRSGYRPPIGELPELRQVFRGLSLGQILDGESFWNIFLLLQTVRSVQQFAGDRQDRCRTLTRFYRTLYPLPKLARAIERTLTPEGELQDDASPELKRIRQQKLGMRKKIEQLIKQLLTDQQVEMYIQDKFFTLRSDRYVVPLKIDGRGRVKGSIYDTSDSGQTLYIELAEVRPLNDALLELESAEKLEILRIFKELSAMAAEDLEVLSNDYQSLIELDILCAEAGLAVRIDAGPARLRQAPCLDLRDARHPLLFLQNGKAVANGISLEEGQLALIVSGPNAGGKTVVLKTVGLLQLMAQARLLLPLDDQSQLYLFRQIFVEIGDAQNLSANLSTFSGHLMGLRPILLQSSRDDLVLLDELAVGTEPQTGCAIGQAVLEELVNRQAVCIVTTHFDNLKSLAVNDLRFRNGSMEFSTRDLKPTYKLVLDIPGQSYGIEVAEQIGLPKHVIERAKDLRGRSSSTMDQILESWQVLREQAEDEKQRYARLKMETESQKHRWEQERQALADAKNDIASKIRARYQSQLDDMKIAYEKLLDDLRQFAKDQKKAPASSEALKDALRERQNRLDLSGRGMQQALDQLSQEFQKQSELPGSACTIDDLQVGSRVYIVSMGKEAVVSKVQKESGGTVEVTAGLLKLRPSIQDLRLLGSTAGPSETKKTPRSKLPGTAPEKSGATFVLPTLTNSLDLRGMDADSALDRAWNFIDKAVLRGESHVFLIHGHGTDTLKKVLRKALAKDAPYALDFRPGEAEEGGDGVTVVHLRQ